MRNVTTISCMFYLYRYVYVITYKCRGRNAGNNKSDKISILVLSILVQRYLVSLISTCNERYLCCRDMQQITVVVRLLKTYREAESSIINDRSRETRNIYAFPSHLQPTHVCCDCWPGPMRMQSDYGNLTNCYKPYRLTMLSDHLINLVG